MNKIISTIVVAVLLLTSCEFQSYGDYEIKPYQGVLTFSEVSKKAEWKNRYEHAAVAYKGKIWILGGYNPGEIRKDTYYDLQRCLEILRWLELAIVSRVNSYRFYFQGNIFT